MKKYRTVIHIVTEGEDAFDAGEKAGDLIDINKLAGDEDISISCEPTVAMPVSEDPRLKPKKNPYNCESPVCDFACKKI